MKEPIDTSVDILYQLFKPPYIQTKWTNISRQFVVNYSTPHEKRQLNFESKIRQIKMPWSEVVKHMKRTK